MDCKSWDTYAKTMFSLTWPKSSVACSKKVKQNLYFENQIQNST